MMSKPPYQQRQKIISQPKICDDRFYNLLVQKFYLCRRQMTLKNLATLQSLRSASEKYIHNE